MIFTNLLSKQHAKAESPVYKTANLKIKHASVATTANMSNAEVADYVSDRLMENIKRQFEIAESKSRN